MAASRETKNATKAPFHCHSQEIFYRFPSAATGSEGFQRASGKPFGRLRRGEILWDTGKARKPPSLPSTRNLFLVRGFVRLRADEVLSPRGKVPKGRRGRPKGACGVAAPGPPVAKKQCTASLAGARPAGLTAYLGGPLSPSAQSIPPPVRWRRLILGVMARGHCHRGALQRYLVAGWGPYRVRVRYGLCRWSRAAGNFLIIKSKAGKHMPLGLGELKDWGRPGRGGGLSAYFPSACCKVRMFSRITSSYLVSAVSSVGPVTTGSRV